MKKSIKVGDEIYNHGDLIRASIHGELLAARLYVSDNLNYTGYICQNVRNGNKPSDGNTFEFLYGWSFRRTSGSSFNSGVDIIEKLDEKEFKNSPYAINIDNSRITVRSKDFLFKIQKSDYPSCCGSQILSKYAVQYLKVPDDEYVMEQINHFVSSSPMMSMVVIKGDMAHKFFTTYLGFKEQTSFKNWNDSNNELILLTKLNDRPEHKKTKIVGELVEENEGIIIPF
jgi:hypothetical protein